MNTRRLIDGRRFAPDFTLQSYEMPSIRKEDRWMPILRYIMMLISAVAISTIGFVMLLEGQGSLVNPVQALPILVNDAAVEEGVTVTVRFEITPRDNPSTTYSNTEQVVQGQHTVPPGIEEQLAGMHPGEVKTFPLSAEEGLGPRDERLLQIIPTINLPVEAQEGDTVADDAGRTARIIWILPEKALIDFNHPLAGQPLIVMLQIVTIENPSEDASPL
jgi:FKBP-type peptidyl-prolyl cis-trans isomerase SlpA